MSIGQNWANRPFCLFVLVQLVVQDHGCPPQGFMIGSDIVLGCYLRAQFMASPLLKSSEWHSKGVH